MAKHHPNKEVSDVIEYAIGRGWRFVKGSGHVYGTRRCPEASRSGCQTRIFSTPKNAGNHARDIRRDIDGCPHRNG